MSKEIKIGGVFTYSHIRNGEVIDTWEEKNIIPDQGLNYVLGAGVAGVSPITTWYVGLFKNNYVPVAGDTAALFPGSGVANESTTDYSQSTRPVWTQAGVSAKTISNTASQAVFTFTASSTTIYGAFLVSTNTKGGTTGTLGAASQFSSSRAMLAGDNLNVTYSLSISSS